MLGLVHIQLWLNLGFPSVETSLSHGLVGSNKIINYLANYYLRHFWKCHICYKFFMVQFQALKLRHCEKATKLKENSHLIWQNTYFYSGWSKQVGDFFKFIWPSQKSWTLKETTISSELWFLIAMGFPINVTNFD